MRLLALALAVSAVAFPQTEPKSTGSVEGQVISITGEPLRKATVALIRTGSAGQPLPLAGGATTGNDGKFLLENLAPGHYSLAARRVGYVTQQSNGAPGQGSLPGPLLDVEVLGGNELTGINLVLTPQAIISGRILDDDGDPADAFVDVAVFRIGWSGGVKQLMRAGKGVMNPDASYMAGGLAPGRYYVGAALPIPPGAREGYVQTFYPHTTDVTSSIPIDIGPGEQIRNLDVRMIKGQRFHIRGKAVGSAVGSGANLLLQITSKDVLGLPPGPPANVGPDGSFEIENVMPGAYVIESALSTSVASAPVHVVDRDLNDIRVPIGPGVTISGEVSAPAMLTFQPTDNSRRPVIATVGEDGKFEARELRPERYRFAISGIAPDVYVKSVQAGSALRANDELDLTDGSDVTLRISLAGHAGSVGGVIRNAKGDPAMNVPVAIWPVAGDGATRSANSGPDGRFQFASLTPGDYLVAAWEELEDGLALNRDFRARFETPAVKVSLDESSHREIEVNAITKGVTQVILTAFY